MLSVPLLFLVMAPWPERGYPLECYECNTTLYVGCTTVVNCSGSERFCTKFTATTISGFVIRQSCSSKCPIAAKKKWPPLYTAMCCQTNRCNRASRVASCRSLLLLATFVSSMRALAALGL
ncbi:uncharacterized protein LOC143845283 [Paroedura picta]|uniref:uncharacterized protein LOC143845283 n=1 Tax=Paroedura picta TaxID=143630 RepID=UPI0040577746